ncbi:hypothetical protein WMF18_15350 [Sorangium sp. So ce315]|uniref:hypothetical protein n=1 Tax=Sorangium sp. So ce315 TaxID=3133299 RepID=UPI003F616DEC
MTARDAGPGWARAKRALETAFSGRGRPRIDRVSRVGHGLSNEVYAAHVELVPDPEGRSGAYAASVPARGSAPRTRASWQREGALLERVAARTRAIRVPRLAAIVPVDGVDVAVRSYLEMAIVTRGARRPIQIDHGLTRLLDAYAAQGRPRIEAPAVHLYELCLVGRWYREALEGEGHEEPPDQLLRRIDNLLRRARAASGARMTQASG